jgi:anti-sigma factor RsiW
MNHHAHPDPQHSQRHAQEQRLERMLRAALFRRTCPDTMTLSDYQLGVLSPSEHVRVRAHVARCPHCQAELARLGTFLADQPVAPSWNAAAGFEWQWLGQVGRRAGRLIIRLAKQALSPPTPDPLPVRGVLDQANEPSAEAGVYRRIALHVEETGGLDVQAEVQRGVADQESWRLTVRAQVPERWPDLAGTMVTVRAGTWLRQVTTDDEGQAVVEGIPDAFVDMITIEVDPDARSACAPGDDLD